jgi:ABC-type sugar transport system permease subunit
MVRSIVVAEGQATVRQVFLDPDGFLAPLLRSAIFACVTAGIAVMLAFHCAASLSAQSRSSRLLLPLLVIPLLGSVAVGLAIHLDLRYPLLTSLFAERSFFATWSLLTLVQLWQLTPLFIYLFVMQLNTASTEMHMFSTVAGATWGERVRDVAWPHCRNLAKLLTLFAVAEGSREFVKPALILKASPGTGTEMIAARLERNYAFWSKVDFSRAVNGTLASSLIVAAVAAVLAIVTMAVVERILRASTVAAAQSPFRMNRGKLAVSLLLLVAAVPLYGTLVHVSPSSLPTLPWAILGVSVALSTVASTATVAFAVIFAIAARVAFPIRLARFDRHAIPIFLVLFAIRLVPPIAVVLCGLHWLYASDALLATTAVFAWLAAQIILTFPLLASFGQFTHFAVSTEEISFHRVCGATPWEVARDSFFLRFKRQYLLIAVFGLAIILGEDAINAIMAFSVPSIAYELSLRIGGRSGSYHEAVMIVALLAVPISSALALLASTSSRKALS